MVIFGMFEVSRIMECWKYYDAQPMLLIRELVSEFVYLFVNLCIS